MLSAGRVQFSPKPYDRRETHVGPKYISRIRSFKTIYRVRAFVERNPLWILKHYHAICEKPPSWIVHVFGVFTVWRTIFPAKFVRFTTYCKSLGWNFQNGFRKNHGIYRSSRLRKEEGETTERFVPGNLPFENWGWNPGTCPAPSVSIVNSHGLATSLLQVYV